MRWPADMYAALEGPKSTTQLASSRPGRPRSARSSTTHLRLMSLVILLIACLALTATYVSWATTRPQTSETGTPSAAAPAKLVAQVTANVVGLTTVDAGRVASLEVQPGEQFTKDTILVRLDDTPHHEALTRAQRELEQANKELRIEEAWMAHEKKKTQAAIERLAATLLGCDADIQAAQATAKRWDQEQERMQGFLKPHLQLQRERDEVELQHALAAAAVAKKNARKLEIEKELAEARVDLDAQSIRALVVEQIQEKILIAKERIASAEAGIERSAVRAPSDGRVVEYLCDSGSDIRRGDRLLAFQSGEELWLEAWATGHEAQDIHVGDEVDIELETEPVQTLVGHVETVAEDANFDLTDEQTKLLDLPGWARTPGYRLRISLPEGRTGLMPGVKASIQRRGASSIGDQKKNELYAGMRTR